MNYIIKNMWGDACKQKVTRNLEDLRISYSLVEIGEVCLTEKIGNNTRHLFKNALSQNGYELIDDKRILLTEKIKNIIVQMVHGSEEWPATNFSVYLSNKVGYHYTYLANLFSELQGITIARFIMTQKIEKVKQFLLTNQYNIKEIASLMKYSSVAHLSTQFKKVTQLSPSEFKNQSKNNKNQFPILA